MSIPHQMPYFSQHHVVTERTMETILPRMVNVRQKLNNKCIQADEIPFVVRSELECLRKRITPGMTVAIPCGSRGIANIGLVIRAIVDFVKECDAVPFIVPAMGSHGGATSDGQTAVIKALGVTEQTAGCPIKSSMEVIKIGISDTGIPVYIDKYAYEADGIILCGRVKAHTAFHGKYESGLLKMAVIGLGKQKGAQVLHADGLSQFSTKIPEVAKVIFEHVNIIGGLAIIENAFEQTNYLEGIVREDIFDREPEILAMSKERMGKIFFDDIDVLVVDQIGKDISGLGMDPNITGRYCVSYLPPEKRIQHVAVLDLTEASHGNANGIGVADITTMRLVNKLNFEEMYSNVLTSTVLSACRIPLVAMSDKECIQLALCTCNNLDRKKPRIVHIQDTGHLEDIEISEGMVDEALECHNIAVCGEAHGWGFNDKGNLF